jgi:hypothetical protein
MWQLLDRSFATPSCAATGRHFLVRWCPPTPMNSAPPAMDGSWSSTKSHSPTARLCLKPTSPSSGPTQGTPPRGSAEKPKVSWARCGPRRSPPKVRTCPSTGSDPVWGSENPIRLPPRRDKYSPSKPSRRSLVLIGQPPGAEPDSREMWAGTPTLAAFLVVPNVNVRVWGAELSSGGLGLDVVLGK